MQTGLLRYGQHKSGSTDEGAGWDPFQGENASQQAGPAMPGAKKKAKNPLRLVVIFVIAIFGAVTILPAIITATMVPFHGSVLIHFGVIGVTILGFVALASSGIARLANARTAFVHLPAIRDPVREAAAHVGLVHRGVISPARSDFLRGAVGDVHTVLAVGGQADGDVSRDMPDEFHGRFPDGSPFWCLLKKSTIPLAGVPEHHRKPGQPNPDAAAQMLTMLVAFPQHRRAGVRLEILHRFMQVRFARIAATLDTGSSEFNMRFFLAARGADDLLPVFRIVTPALQTLLINLFERFWLVNVVVNDTTGFLSAVAFNPQDGAPERGDAWIGAALSECIAGAARAKIYLD